MTIDGILYIVIAMFGFLQTAFASDDAAKYITAQNLFWIKLVVGTLAAGGLALKMYRSTAFAEHVAKKNGNGDTKFFKPAVEVTKA